MKSNLLFLCFTLFVGSSFCQSINMEFSTPKKVNPKKEGTVSQFIGGSNDLIFTINKNIGIRTKEKFTYLVGTDKKTLKEVIRTPLYGKGTPRSVYLKKAKLVKSYANKEGVVLIWAFKESKTSDVYKAEVLDKKLKPVGKLKELLNTESITKKDRKAEVIAVEAIQSKSNKEDFSLIYEVSFGEGKAIQMGYVKFDSRMDKVMTGKVELPVQQLNKRAPSSLTGFYFFSNDGFIFSKHFVLVDDEKSKKFWKTGKTKVVLNRIEPESDQITEINIEHPKMSLTDISFASNSKKSIIFGLFKDPDLYDGASANDGTFMVSFNERSKEVDDFKFSYFTKEQMDVIYHRKELTGRSKKKADKKAAKAGAESDGKMETVDGSLVIEYADLDENGELFFAASFMYNYVVQVCTTSSTGAQSCYDKPYCSRQDINGVKLDKEGNILFAENIRRSCVYPGWNVYDVNILKKDSKYFAFYGSGIVSNKEGGRDKKKEKELKKKEKKEGLSTMFYASFDSKEATAESKVYEIKQTSTKKKEKKSMNNLNVAIIDNEIYSYNTVSSLSPIKAPIAFTSCLLIFPIYYVALTPRSYLDYYGTMVRVTGK
ncbi:MAG: hypothetical protein KJ941_09315 [Bacteroidetes bacterium]|nr:hypothetical protein [Bacteroidota bacterium]